MNILQIQIVKGMGADKVSLHTDMPSPEPAVTDWPLRLDFQAEVNTAEAYVKSHFPGIPVEVIETGRLPMRFSRHD